MRSLKHWKSGGQILFCSKDYGGGEGECCTVSLTAFSLISTATTLAPCLANRMLASRPIPADAPVTMATLPSSLLLLEGSEVASRRLDATREVWGRKRETADKVIPDVRRMLCDGKAMGRGRNKNGNGGGFLCSGLRSKCFWLIQTNEKSKIRKKHLLGLKQMKIKCWVCTRKAMKK